MRALRSRTVQSDSCEEDGQNLKNKRSKKSKKTSKIKQDSSSQSDVDVERKSKKKTRKTRDVVKENISPNIKETSGSVSPQHTRKSRKSRRNGKSEEYIDFTNIVTSTVMKPKLKDGKRSSFETSFKNIVSSTTIKPKKPKLSITKKPDPDIGDASQENSIINISDSILPNTTNKNVTDVLNNTYLKIDESVQTTNNSGQWKIEKQKSPINISGEVFTSPVDANKDPKKVLFQEKSPKSARKKWQRFPRNSQGANSILEQISTPRKKSPKLNQSTNKIKRTAMPNFALIHQKAFEKMESIADYSQRKKNRANLLLTTSNKKLQQQAKEPTEPENKIKSSRQLFSQEKAPVKSEKLNRFGFKLKTVQTNLPIVMPIKPSIYQRDEIVAIANKKPQNTNSKIRDNKRDILKGVRTNRRFDLLMKMRNN